VSIRKYTNPARQTFLTVSVTAGSPGAGGTLNVDDTTDWPSPGAGEEAVGAMDFGNQAKVELFTYTGKTATTLTGITRGIDGTTAQAHTVGAVVRHVASAYDLENAANAKKLAVVTKTATYTATDLDDVILCNGTFTVTLPTAVGRAGKTLHIKNIGTGTVTIDGAGTETIDGSLTKVLGTQWHTYSIVSDGTNWEVF
jgi:hypothetical protein